MNSVVVTLFLILAGAGILGFIGLALVNEFNAWKRNRKANNEFRFDSAPRQTPSGDDFIFDASDGSYSPLPGSKTYVNVRSFTDPGEAYRLAPSECRCSCPDWIKRRGGFPVGDPRRMCKHLIRHWCESPSGFPEHLAWYADEFRFRYGIGAGFNPYAKREDVIIFGNEIVELYRDDQSEWVNIFDGTKRYGFNPALMRWAYDNEPGQSREIIKAIFGIGPDLLPGCINTVSRRAAVEKDRIPPFVNRSIQGCALIIGEVEGVGITALINPRAGWQNMIIEGMGVDVNIKDGRTNIPAELMHLELALSAWVSEEYELARQAWKKSKA